MQVYNQNYNGVNSRFIVGFKDKDGVFQLQQVVLFSSPFALKYETEEPILLQTDTLVGKSKKKDLDTIFTPIINNFFKKDNLTVKTYNSIIKYKRLFYDTNYYTADVILSNNQSSRKYNIVFEEDDTKITIVLSITKQ